MRDAEPVVADTSPLLSLALIDRLDVIRDQFATVTVPEQVWEELVAGDEGVEALRRLHEDGTLEVVTIDETPLFAEFRHELDVGEAATLAYALETNADLVLLDEREARQTARRHDLSVTGAIGILLRAARTGDVALRAELNALRSAGFWISDELYEEVLNRADDEPE